MKKRKMGAGPGRKKKKSCPFRAEGIKEIDYKDLALLSRFVTERGKILPKRITGVSAYFQKKLTCSIKRARYMAILPYTAKE
jgi:small subunit ribosomal protein S18